jgi:hypothetical protein
LNAFVSNIVKNNVFYINSGFAYEFATSEGAVNNEMLYGLNATPSINFWGSRGHYYGVKSDINRFFYRNNEGKQILTATLIPYYNIMLNNKSTFKMELIFDYDQDNEQEVTEFNNNMEDAFNIGLGHALTKRVYTNIYAQLSIYEASLDKSFVGGNMSVTF